MSSTHVEIEAKYTVPDADTFARLLTAGELGPYRLEPVGQLVLADHYLDTADRDLHRGGHAYRLSEVDGQCLVTLESLGTPRDEAHHREEHETRVPRDARHPHDWPEGRARDLALSLGASRPLVELLVIQRQRERRELWQGERRVGELSLDVVEFGTGPRRTRVHELEIELGPAGTHGDLLAAGEALDVHRLQPARQSTFERALALLDGPATAAQGSPVRKKASPGIHADMPMAEAGRVVLRLHYEGMLAHEAGTLAGDVEALHDMRVATRRQRAAFRIFAPCYARKTIRPIRRELRRLAGSMGVVRDLDVQIDMLRAYQAAQAAGTARALQSLLDDWVGEREGARRELIAHLGSDEYRGLEEAYGRFLVGEGAAVACESPAASPQRVKNVLPQVVSQCHGAVDAYAAVLPWATSETLHALRIEGKRFRYALEFFLEVLGPRAERLVAGITELQDHLGELHDCDVAIGRLQEFLLRSTPAPLAPDAKKAIGDYGAACQARLRLLQRTVGRPWRRIDCDGFRRLLSQAVGRLE